MTEKLLGLDEGCEVVGFDEEEVVGDAVAMSMQSPPSAHACCAPQ